MLDNVRFLRTLTKSTRFHALLSIDKSTSQDHIDAITNEAELLFEKVHKFTYPALPHNPWPIPQNEAFQNTVRFLEAFSKCPFLWYESDAVALKPQWLDLIYEQYMKGKKPFMGHIVQGVLPSGHMNGVGVYPWQITWFSTEALMCRTTAWDVAMSPKTIPHTQNANNLFQHVWTENVQDKLTATSKDQAVTFPNWEKVEKVIDFNMAIMHRSKDGSLIKRLSEHYFGECPTETCVPQLHSKKEPEEKPQTFSKLQEVPIKFNGSFPYRVEVMIVTYWKDIPWLEYCLKAITKFLSGHAGVTLVVPENKVEKFLRLVKQYKVKMLTFQEAKGKGMMHHEALICSADEYVPKGTDYVMHLDADCIFHTPTHVADYFSDGKPHYVVRSINSLTDPKTGFKQDNLQWVQYVERDLGRKCKWYTMCRHPTVYPVGLYKPLRERIEKTSGKKFLDHVLSQKNSFPQTFAEFPTMGDFAFEVAEKDFFWIDCSNGLAPADRQKTYWSHGGLDQLANKEKNITAKEEIEGFLK